MVKEAKELHESLDKSSATDEDVEAALTETLELMKLYKLELKGK